MQRLAPILDDAGILQTTQTAYRKGVSCQDSIFAGMETLFNLVLDPLLSALKERNLGLSINDHYLGAFAHTDDIHTCATNMEDAAEQLSTVNTFT